MLVNVCQRERGNRKLRKRVGENVRERERKSVCASGREIYGLRDSVYVYESIEVESETVCLC